MLQAKPFDDFLSNPDPAQKAQSLIQQYGGADWARKYLDSLEQHNYINNVDAAKVRKALDAYREAS